MSHGGPLLKCLEYKMEEFLVSCVERYHELVPGFKLRKVATPFLPDPPPAPAGPVPTWDSALGDGSATPADVG